MAKIHRVSMYIVDPNGKFDNKDMVGTFSKFFGNVLAGTWPEQMHIETSESFDWQDGCPEDKANCDLAYLARHFVPNCDDADAKQVKVGEFYRHFKGKVVRVISVARHTETQELFVVYVCDNGTGVWCRPLSMFVSDVDREKYPDVKQRKRFELIEPLMYCNAMGR